MASDQPPQESSLESAIHYHLVRGLIDDGFAPDLVRLQELVGRGPAAVIQALERLEASHSLVCHPGHKAPWVIHPFSLSPTATWVQAGQRGWWSPCIWCALGVAALVDDDVIIHSRVGGETEDLDLHVCGGIVREDSILTHFAVPVSSAWDNVHHFCATVLPFRSEADVDVWCRRHAIPKGAVVPIGQVAEVARIWYGQHAERHWKKWSITQAREIFGRVGLTGPFWALASDAGRESF
jgi:Alkylmercury lyase